MKRRTARENAMLALYEASYGANSIEEIITDAQADKDRVVGEYGEKLLALFYEHSAEVDDLIKSKLVKWTLERLPRVDAAILRLAVAEMLYIGDDMDSIVINEAVEIAKKYSGDEDYQFINGVLGSISRDRTGEPTAEPDTASEPEG